MDGSLSCADHIFEQQILREVGLKGYEDGLRFIRECDLQEFRFIEKSIQNYFVGPDCYWKESRSDVTRAPGVSHFGTAWWIPFPPSLVSSSCNKVIDLFSYKVGLAIRQWIRNCSTVFAGIQAVSVAEPSPRSHKKATDSLGSPSARQTSSPLAI